MELGLDSAVPYLVERELIADGTPQLLTGGVSATVVAVDTGERRLVVKQALRQFRVAQTWLADPARAGIEAAALELLHPMTPEHTPALIDHDSLNHIVVMEGAPVGWRTWKTELLGGLMRKEVAEQLGTVLARWHSGTAGLADPRFTDLAGFTDQRIDPYFRTIQHLHPSVDAVVENMLSRRVCLVHGDFSPKNVLVGAGRLWVLDFEIAHVGDPTFDLAFMLNHLLLKAIHLSRPDRLHQPFLVAYRAGGGLPIEDDHLHRLVGCLLLARVDGKSPAEYLTEHQRDQARQRALAILSGKEQVWP